MFWLYIIVMIFALSIFIVTYVFDPVALINFRVQRIDPSEIQKISEDYVNNTGVKIDKNIEYRFVRYITDRGYEAEDEDTITLGTFHVWNDTYYIDISVDLYKSQRLEEVVIHETRHMIVEYLRENKIIDLTKYTEEIAQHKNSYYNSLFNSSVYLLKEQQENEE